MEKRGLQPKHGAAQSMHARVAMLPTRSQQSRSGPVEILVGKVLGTAADYRAGLSERSPLQEDDRRGEAHSTGRLPEGVEEFGVTAGHHPAEQRPLGDDVVGGGDQALRGDQPHHEPSDLDVDGLLFRKR
jgi:hypothetical protein